VSADAERELRAQLVSAGSRLARLGLIAGTEGNLSARLGPDRIVVTPAGVAKGELEPEALVLIDVETADSPTGLGLAIRGGSPTSELGMHLALYRRSGIGAVIHAHPPHATAFAAAGIPLEPPVVSEQAILLGEVPLLSFSVPGTPDVAARVETLPDPCRAFLLANHGATTTGATVGEAMDHMEILESCARVTWLARTLNPQAGLGPEQISLLKALREHGGA
jgi:L-fuculose-phosphate aldolase